MNNLAIQVRIDIRQENYGSGGLTLAHDFRVRPCDFSEIAAILQKYDELSKAIEKAKGV